MRKIFYLAPVLGLLVCCNVSKSKKRTSNQKKHAVSAVINNKPHNKTTIIPKSIIQKKQDYINKYKDIAIQNMNYYGIPASITLAQALWESAYGTSRLATLANNHFGIKCHNWNGPSIKHDDDKLSECFRKYQQAEKSFSDHALFLKNRKHYHSLFNIPKKDYKAWAHGLKKAGYATDINYPKRLIAVIEEFALYRFDEPSKSNKNINFAKNINTYEDVYDYEKIKSKNTSSSKELEKPHEIELNSDTPPYNNKESEIQIDSKRETPNKNKKYVFVSPGETLYSIANQYGISVDTLKKYNNLQDNTIYINQLLYIELFENKDTEQTIEKSNKNIYEK